MAQDFNITFPVDQTPKEVFDAVNNVRGWWSVGIEGGTEDLNDEFTYTYGKDHICSVRLIEVIPNKKVVWLILDNYFSFSEEKEWNGTKVEFAISEKGDKTELNFTHWGLNPAWECYDICFDGWTKYIKHSLHKLITTGKGMPNPWETIPA